METGVSIKKAVLILLATAIIVVAAGIAVGNAFFWNEYPTQTPVDYALQAALQAVAENPENATVHLHLGYLYLVRGENEKALEYYSEAYRLEPEDRQVQYNMALGYVANEMYTEAADMLEPLAQEGILDFEANFTYGLAAFKAGRTEKARQAFEQVLLIRPGAADAYYYLGQIYEQEEDFAKALTHFEKALQFLPGSTELQEAVDRVKGVAGGGQSGS
jgi:tetratricopeptide (TPR) repeat protein